MRKYELTILTAGNEMARIQNLFDGAHIEDGGYKELTYPITINQKEHTHAHYYYLQLAATPLICRLISDYLGEQDWALRDLLVKADSPRHTSWGAVMHRRVNQQNDREGTGGVYDLALYIASQIDRPDAVDTIYKAIKFGV